MNIDMPIINSPIYTTTLPLSKKTVKFRPYKVKEQRMFAEALHGDKVVLGGTIKAILEACTFNEFDLNDIPAVDTEWLFLYIRSKAVGESIDLKFRCDHIEKETGNPCGATNRLSVDLDGLEVEDVLPELQVKLDEDLYVEMKYPNFDTIIHTWEDKQLYDVISSLISKIIQGETVYDVKDMPVETIMEQFIDNLHDVSPLEDFYNALPQLSIEESIACHKCKKKSRVVLDGLKDFLV